MYQVHMAPLTKIVNVFFAKRRYAIVRLTNVRYTLRSATEREAGNDGGNRAGRPGPERGICRRGGYGAGDDAQASGRAEAERPTAPPWREGPRADAGGARQDRGGHTRPVGASEGRRERAPDGPRAVSPLGDSLHLRRWGFPDP